MKQKVKLCDEHLAACSAIEFFSKWGGGGGGLGKMVLLSCPRVVLVLNTWLACINLMSLVLAFNSERPPARLGSLEKPCIKISL